MRYVQLRAFHHVAIHGGFSRAARALFVTQPAVSDQVRKLETEYDVQLFDRRTKRIVVTEEGRRLLAITRRLFEAEQSALDFLGESRALRTGALRIVADSAQHLMPTLAEFRRRHPDVFVSLRAGNSEQVMSRLRAYEADIGVLGDMPSSDRSVESVLLGSSDIVAFVARDGEFAAERSFTLERLAELPLVLREPGSRTRARLEAHAARRGLALRPCIEAEGREAVREIVAAGGGVGIVSEAEFGRDTALCRVSIEDAGLSMDEAIVCLRERRDSKLVSAFMALARGGLASAEPSLAPAVPTPG